MQLFLFSSPGHSVSFAVVLALLFLENTFLISFEIHELHLLAFRAKKQKAKNP